MGVGVGGGGGEGVGMKRLWQLLQMINNSAVVSQTLSQAHNHRPSRCSLFNSNCLIHIYNHCHIRQLVQH